VFGDSANGTGVQGRTSGNGQTAVLGTDASSGGGTGVTGNSTHGTGVFGSSANGTGVFAASATGTALTVTGKVTFSSSGTATVAAGKASVTVSHGGVTPSSLVLATCGKYSPASPSLPQYPARARSPST
jgi:hypothetical protein